MGAVKVTLIGGTTALIEVGGFRLLTDPTFDSPGEYKLPHVTLTKLSGPALTAEQVGAVDAVLLSHDQHADNFDNAGKTYAMRAPRLLTTQAGAKRLGGFAEGLAPWDSFELTKPDGTSRRRRRGTDQPVSNRSPATSSVSFFRRHGLGRSTLPAIRSGMPAWPMWRSALTLAWCCCSPAPPRHAARST